MAQNWLNMHKSKEEIDQILFQYQDKTKIYIDLEEWKDMEKPVQNFQKSIIKELNQQFKDLRLDKQDYLDAALERIDESYNLQLVIVINHWDVLLEEKEYQRFLKNIFKNGILKRDIIFAILNGKYIHEQNIIQLDSFQEV